MSETQATEMEPRAVPPSASPIELGPGKFVLPGCTAIAPYGYSEGGRLRKRPTFKQRLILERHGIAPQDYGKGDSPRKLDENARERLRGQLERAREHQRGVWAAKKAKAAELYGEDWKEKGIKLKCIRLDNEPEPAQERGRAKTRGLEVQQPAGPPEWVAGLMSRFDSLEKQVGEAHKMVRQSSLERSAARAAIQERREEEKRKAELEARQKAELEGLEAARKAARDSAEAEAAKVLQQPITARGGRLF